jgi:hypothetical protein
LILLESFVGVTQYKPNSFDDTASLPINATLPPKFNLPSAYWTVIQARAVAAITRRRLLRNRNLMNYGAFTNDSVAMMYEAVRGALAAGDALERQVRKLASA